MNYEEFLNEAKETLTMLLSEDYPGISITAVDVEKMQNGSYRGLSVREDGQDVAMTMNLEPLFEEVLEGGQKELILGKFAREIRERLEDMPVFDIGEISNYDVMKENLSIQMVSIQGNEHMLSEVPHKEMADLAAVYRVQIGRDTSFLVTNNMLNGYGISREQLQTDAERYAPQHAPVSLRTMGEVMAEMMPPGMELPEPEPKMFVATVQDQSYGAGVIAYPHFMEMAAERIGGEFFVLPSSVHEVLLVPDNGEMDWKELENMVRTVNETTVEPQEKLSDHVYHYDSQEKLFELASSHGLRMAEKRLEHVAERPQKEIAKSVQEKTGKKSVLEELRNNKTVCDKENAKHERHKMQPGKGER